MGYIPPAPRGVLFIQAGPPPANPDIAWWDTVSGKLFRYSEAASEWLEVGVPDPPLESSVALGGSDVPEEAGVTYLGYGAGPGTLSAKPGDIAIGAGATVGGTPL